jgi:hypothetical protein
MNDSAKRVKKLLKLNAAEIELGKEKRDLDEKIRELDKRRRELDERKGVKLFNFKADLLVWVADKKVTRE